MLQCCNALLHMLQFKPRKGGWPTGLRPWTPRGHSVAPVRRPLPHRSGREVLKDAMEPTLTPHSISFPSPSLYVCRGGNKAAAIAASSAATARTHHCTTVLQTLSLAPSLLPLPHPSLWVLLWAAGEVTFRIRHGHHGWDLVGVQARCGRGS
jgi:hypothetical protein